MRMCVVRYVQTSRSDKPYVYGRIIKPYHLPTARARRAVKGETHREVRTPPRASRGVPAPITHKGYM